MRGPLVSTYIAAAFVLSGCTGLAGNGSDGMGPIGATEGGAGGMPPPAMNAAGNAGTSNPTPGAGAGGAGGAESPPVSTAPVATPAIARLSTLQWANTVRALLQLPSPGDLDNALTKDAVVRFDNEADSLFVSQDLHDDLQSEAERLAALVTATPANVAKLVPAGAPTDTAGKAKAYIEDFGRRAYRRPLTADEVQAYITLFNQGPTLTSGMGAFEAGMRVTLEAFLQAPDFLFRTSIGGTATSGKARLNDYEIAANLSYALTNGPPDATLAAAADQSALSAAGALEAQAKRLIATDGGKSAVDRFFFPVLRARPVRHAPERSRNCTAVYGRDRPATARRSAAAAAVPVRAEPGPEGDLHEHGRLRQCSGCQAVRAERHVRRQFVDSGHDGPTPWRAQPPGLLVVLRTSNSAGQHSPRRQHQ